MVMGLNNITNQFSGSSGESGNFFSNAPDAYVLFFPYKDLEGSDMSTGKVLVSREILSIGTNKGKKDIGSWTINLSPTQNFSSIIHPGDWMLIYMSNQQFPLKPGGNFKDSGLKMVGIVKSVRRIESMNPTTGIRSVRYVISGNDFTSAINDPAYLNLKIANVQNPTQAAAITGASPDIKGPATNLAGILSFIFTGAFSWKTKTESQSKQKIESPDTNNGKKTLTNLDNVIGDGRKIPAGLCQAMWNGMTDLSFLKWLTFKFQGNLIGAASALPDLNGIVGGLSALRTFANSCVNELYADLIGNSNGDLMPTLVLRSIPFNINKMSIQSITMMDGVEDKETIAKSCLYVSKKISESEIFQLNYGKFDSERFNFFMVVPKDIGDTKKDNVEAMIIQQLGGDIQLLSSRGSVKKYGLRPFITNSYYGFKDISLFKKYTQIARDMWQTAHLYDNGVVTIVGPHEHIPIGTNIIFKDRGWLAHVENVSYQYSVDPNTGAKSYRADIAFVRLQTLDGKPLNIKKSEPQSATDPGITDSEGTKEEQFDNPFPKLF